MVRPWQDLYRKHGKFGWELPEMLAGLRGLKRLCAIGAGPIDAPAMARHAHPEKLFRGSTLGVMVERGGALVEAAGVPGIAESEALEIEMMAELVAEGAEESAEGSDFLANGGFHPNADKNGIGMIVAEKFCSGVFANAQRTGGENASVAATDVVEIRGGTKEAFGGEAHGVQFAGLHCGFDLCSELRQTIVRREGQGMELIALLKELGVFPARRGVGQHCDFIVHEG